MANKDDGAHGVFFIMQRRQRVRYIAHRLGDKGSIGRYWGHLTIR